MRVIEDGANAPAAVRPPARRKFLFGGGVADGADQAMPRLLLLVVAVAGDFVVAVAATNCGRWLLLLLPPPYVGGQGTD